MGMWMHTFVFSFAASFSYAKSALMTDFYCCQSMSTTRKLKNRKIGTKWIEIQQSQHTSMTLQQIIAINLFVFCDLHFTVMIESSELVES